MSLFLHLEFHDNIHVSVMGHKYNEKTSPFINEISSLENC